MTQDIQPTTVDTELAVAAAAADAVANPTAGIVQSFLSLFNGTTWDRARRGTVTGSLLTDEARPATGAKTSVNDAATSTTILASNTARKGAAVFNDSTSILYLDLTGGTASTTSYSVQLDPNAYYELPYPCYTGAITGIWSADASGAARVTEWS